MDLIIANMVTRPQRSETNEASVMSIIDDVDFVYICLNEYIELPEWADHPKIRYIYDVDYGAAGMFCFSDKVPECYFLIIGDDMTYSKGYVDKIINGINKYNKKAVVSLQGSIKGGDVVSYHKRTELKEDTFCNVLGSGVMGYHTSLIRFDMSKIVPRNYVDINLGIQAQNKKIPMVCLEHTGTETVYYPQCVNSLSFEKSRNPEIQNELINNQNWEVWT